MRRRIRAWRRRQRSQITFVPVAVPGSEILASGLCRSSRYRMVEFRRGA